MPSLETARRLITLNSSIQNIGQSIKSLSDDTEELLWDNCIESKICYIYDYFHDDKPDISYNITHANTTKTQIQAKFIVKTHQSIDKDQVEYYIQFKPSQKTFFSEKDDLYYFETEYRQKYGVQDFPIGLYIDIPDDAGIYKKWLICSKEISNQFVKFLILPCNYHLHWIEKDGQYRHKRSMWVVLRNQNSYTIGQYTDRYFTRPDNQQKLWVGLNTITEKFWYTDNDQKTMRLVVSANTPNPIVWSVTKIENAQPLGLQKLTLYQSSWDEHRDSWEYDEYGNYVPYADYDTSADMIETAVISPIVKGKIIATNSNLKIGGSYKTLTFKIYDLDDNDLTERYNSSQLKWSYYVNDDDITDFITELDGKSFNQKKIKFKNDRKYLSNILTVKCEVANTDITAMAQFELTI